MNYWHNLLSLPTTRRLQRAMSRAERVNWVIWGARHWQWQGCTRGNALDLTTAGEKTHQASELIAPVLIKIHQDSACLCSPPLHTHTHPASAATVNSTQWERERVGRWREQRELVGVDAKTRRQMNLFWSVMPCGQNVPAFIHVFPVTSWKPAATAPQHPGFPNPENHIMHLLCTMTWLPVLYTAAVLALGQDKMESKLG